MRTALDLIRTFPVTTAAICMLLFMLPMIFNIIEIVQRILTRTM